MKETALRDALDASCIRYANVGGVPTRYWEGGAGEPLVLFHGGHFGSLYSLDSFSLALPGLAERFHVYAVDKLAQGFTGNPEPERYTFDALLEHSIALLDSLGIRSAHLLGHSRGALLVAAIALARPDLARSCLCISTNTLAPDDPRLSAAGFYAAVEARTPPGEPTAAGVRLEPDAQAFSRDQVTDDFVERLLEIARLPKTAEARAWMRDHGDRLWTPSLADHKARVWGEIDALGLPAPTLIMWGANDRSAFLPLAYSLFDRVRARTRRTSLHVVNGSGHYVFRERPAEFVATLGAFCL